MRWRTVNNRRGRRLHRIIDNRVFAEQIAGHLDQLFGVHRAVSREWVQAIADKVFVPARYFAGGPVSAQPYRVGEACSDYVVPAKAARTNPDQKDESDNAQREK